MILVLILAVIVGLHHHKSNSSVLSKPLEVISLTIKGDKIIKGPSTIQAASGKEIKITTRGIGYGEGDNMIIKGYSQSFFELDELDGPMTQYVTITKPGTYPLIIQNSRITVGKIVIN